MDRMRDILQSSLGKALSSLSPLDRVTAAWPVAAGHAIAARSSVTALDGTVATVHINDGAWHQQLNTLRPRLIADLARASRVPLTDILFTSPKNTATKRTLT